MENFMLSLSSNALVAGFVAAGAAVVACIVGGGLALCKR